MIEGPPRDACCQWHTCRTSLAGYRFAAKVHTAKKLAATSRRISRAFSILIAAAAVSLVDDLERAEFAGGGRRRRDQSCDALAQPLADRSRESIHLGCLSFRDELYAAILEILHKSRDGKGLRDIFGRPPKADTLHATAVEDSPALEGTSHDPEYSGRLGRA